MTARPGALAARPEAEAAETSARLEALGYRAIPAPSLVVDRLERAQRADLAAVDAALFTSPAAARAFLEDLGPAGGAGVAAFCVGDKTAALAASAGFAPVCSADGDGSDLAALLTARLAGGAGPRRLVFFRGADLARPLAEPLRDAGFQLAERTLYRARPATALPEPARAALFSPEGVAAALFFSARAVRAFAGLADGADLSRAAAICLSPRIADATPPGVFGAVAAAERPRLDAALSLLVTIRPPKRGPRERLY